MLCDGIGQRQRQRFGQLPRPRRPRCIAPLSRGLYAGQLVGGLAAVAGDSRRLQHARHSLAQPAARGHRPPIGQRQAGVHKEVIYRHARPRLRDSVIRFGRLPEFGVCFGQGEVARRP